MIGKRPRIMTTTITRNPRLYGTPLIAAYVLVFLSGLSASASSYFEGGTINLIQGSHSDIGWRDGSIIETQKDNHILDAAITLAQQDSTFKKDMEDTLRFKQYMDNRPQSQVDALKDMVNAGRFEFGASYSSPYEDILSGELMARQFYFGRKGFRATFPKQDTITYWNQDVPGRGLQMSQLLRKAGVLYEFTSRYYNSVPGVPNNSIAKWASPDGSSVLVLAYAHYGQYDYGNFGEAIIDMNSIPSIKEHVDKWDDYFSSHKLPKQLPLFLSRDDRTPRDFREQIAAWNKWASANGYPTMRYATMSQAIDQIAAGDLSSVDTISGGRPNLWLYEAAPTNHIPLSYQRDGSRLAAAAETFCTIRAIQESSFRNYPQKTLCQVWQNLSWACHGWAKQTTVEEFTRTYKEAMDSAQTTLTDALTWISKQVDTKGQAAPLIVFNTLSWPRTDVVIAGVPSGLASPFTLKDSSSAVVPYQIIADGKIVFVAKDVPSMGYKTYYFASGGRTPVNGDAYNTAWTTAYTNDYYKITPTSGGISSIYDKSASQELLDPSRYQGAELLVLDSNNGMGAGEFTTFPYAGLIHDRSTTHKMTWMCTEDGPVRKAYETTHTFSDFIYRLKVIIYAGIKRIDFEPTVIDWSGANNCELRLAFPINSNTRDVAFDVPFAVSKVGYSEVDPAGFGFGAKHQPREIQNFMYAGGKGWGITLGSSIAPMDYMDPQANSANTDAKADRTSLTNTVLQPILLATRTSCAGDGYYWSQPGTHAYKFCLTSHQQGWQNGCRSGIQFNNALIAAVPATKDADAGLPETMSFVSVDKTNIIISAVKKAEDDDTVVVRLYDVEGIDGIANVKFAKAITGAKKTSLIEEDGERLSASGSTAAIPVERYAIETAKLCVDLTTPSK